MIKYSADRVKPGSAMDDQRTIRLLRETREVVLFPAGVPIVRLPFAFT
jgi:hypothetical protein